MYMIYLSYIVISHSIYIYLCVYIIYVFYMYTIYPSILKPRVCVCMYVCVRVCAISLEIRPYHLPKEPYDHPVSPAARQTEPYFPYPKNSIICQKNPIFYPKSPVFCQQEPHILYPKSLISRHHTNNIL